MSDLSAPPQNETLLVIRRRRSVRSYTGRQVPDDAMRAILEAGLCAPHSGGMIEENTRLTVIQNFATLERINAMAKAAAYGSGMEWLMRLGADPSFHCLYHAPTLILVSARTDSPCPEYDCSAITENMLLAAESLGLGGCWLYFPLQAFAASPEDGGGAALARELGIPDGFRAYTALVLGCRQTAVAPAPALKMSNINYLR